MRTGIDKSPVAYIKHILAIPSTQVMTSLLLVFATAFLALSTSIGTKYLSSNGAVDINKAKVKSISTSRNIGDAIDLTRLPIIDNTIAKPQDLKNTNEGPIIPVPKNVSSTSLPQKSSTSRPEVNTTTSTTVATNNKLINSFAFSSYLDSDDLTIIFNWDTKNIDTPNRYIIKRTTNKLITPEDPIALTIVDNDEYIFSDAFTYNDLRDEGLYLEIQRFSDNNWTTLETSKTIFK